MKDNKCDKTHFSVRLHYVCFGLLMQISLADYSAYLILLLDRGTYLYELQVSCIL